MKQLIEIVGDFIHVTGDTGKILAIPKTCFPGAYVGVSYDDLLLLVCDGGNFHHTKETLFKFASGYSDINEKWIIIAGEFIDIKRVCESVNIYIGDDEIVPKLILRQFTKDGNNLCIKGVRINSGEFAIPVHEWKEPTKKIPITKGLEHWLIIDGTEYHRNSIKQMLQKKFPRYHDSPFLMDGCYMNTENIPFSGGYLSNLMKSVAEIPVKKEIDETPTRTIIGFRREGKMTATFYSDGSIEIDNNNENIDSDPKISSVCKNILMNWDNTHMTLNCSGKIRKIPFNEIHFPGLNSDGTYIFILGNDEKITESIKVHLGVVEDSGIQKIKNLLLGHVPAMCRSN